ncbi:PREDICTED: uncharacterized protein LOC109179153 [Ipomoea nil]|uniref:uncharacterized protein LOC109179153 n=1 Tax=Ipomoea nil TaxID=35883 RepID=UPI0009018B61|nr:PREDICTED: uncharacterized protein LOC109179153 [Ipomoea nil]
MSKISNSRVVHILNEYFTPHYKPKLCHPSPSQLSGLLHLNLPSPSKPPLRRLCPPPPPSSQPTPLPITIAPPQKLPLPAAAAVETGHPLPVSAVVDTLPVASLVDVSIAVTAYMKPNTETYNWVIQVYTRAESYNRRTRITETK